MAIKSDGWIIDACETKQLITPYVTTQVSDKDGVKLISYGVSSYGYDIRVGNEFTKLKQYESATLDPKKSEHSWEHYTTDMPTVVNPGSFILARSVETFKIPRNILAICLGKSTYARCGVIVNVTPLEPEWEGVLTIEISNTSPVPVFIYPNEGIAQLLFLESDEVCTTSYSDKKGKYQSQTGVTIAKLK